jgi:excisionase family DNA binding protein
MPETTSSDNQDAQPLLLRPEQVATLLNISRATAYRLIALGEVPSIRVGRSRRTSRSQLEHYVAGLEQR